MCRVGIDVDRMIATGSRGRKMALKGIFKTGARGAHWGMMVRRKRVI